MLKKEQQLAKRLFDFLISLVGLVVCIVPILFLIILTTIVTKKFGLFRQERIGQHAKPFTIYKIRTMYDKDYGHKVSKIGQVLRTSKLDELPQLYNVFNGTMSLVGPRPDIRGYADALKGEDRIVLAVKPGITGPATLKYRNEDELLASQPNPQEYNDTVIWKDKIAINKQYVENWSFTGDIKYIIQTIFN
ncbi:MAG: sugar transferase [Flavobacteriaceae bacterium]|nr:sugar transferase [Flavobacteriaceae bacterium]